MGHLPKEISRATKCIIDRGAVVTVEISSDHCRRSPLVQGGLEVPCNITVKTHPSFNLNVLKKYEELVNTLYAEPKNEEITGTFISINSQPSVSRPEISSKDDGGRRKYKIKKNSRKEVVSKDIREIWKSVTNRDQEPQPARKQRKDNQTMVIIDSD